MFVDPAWDTMFGPVRESVETMIDQREFETLVDQALSEIPGEFLDNLENIEVIVEETPSREILSQFKLEGRGTLFGLYQGVPLTRRSVFQPFSMPDRITIFRVPILQVCRTRQQIIEQVKRTVIHEIAHHFGISDQRLRELGY